jgi:hypothetical protein
MGNRNALKLSGVSRATAITDPVSIMMACGRVHCKRPSLVHEMPSPARGTRRT